MRYLKTFNEMIKVPIKVGDTVLGGRFKNKKTVVKKIGKNDKGDITINGKPLLKYRIVKESIDKIAGVWDTNEKFEDGDDFKIKFRVSDIIELAKDKPVEEVDPKSINYDFSGRQEDPTETKQRVMNADLSYPIVVVQNEEGKIFTMLDGTHRLEKALILGLDKIQIKIMDKEELVQFKADRIVKESASYDRLQEDVEDYLAHLNDDFEIEVAGSQLIGNPIRNNYYIRIWKQKDTSKPYTFNNCVEFTWSEIEEEVLRFISIIEENWDIDYLYGISQLNSSDWYNGGQSHEHRTMFTKNELSNLNGNSELKSFVIGLVKDVSKLDESTVSTFSQDIKSLIPKSIDLINSDQHKLELKDVMLNGDLIQIVYYHNKFEETGDALSDGEPDYLEIDIHTLKDNDGTKANPDTLRLNIDITYGDAMMFSFTIDKDNGLNVHHYDGINSKYDPESTFYFSDDTIKDLVEFFNRFDDYQLTPKDFTFLDSDPNSYQPNL